MPKPIEEMTVSGRIRSLRMALRKAGHPKVDHYSATYLCYVTDKCKSIEEAVVRLLIMDG